MARYYGSSVGRSISRDTVQGDNNDPGTAWFDAMRLEIGDNVTRNTYDSNENYVTSVKDGLGNTVYSTYDASGNTLTAKDAKNQTTSFQYDQNNLLTQVTDAKNGVTLDGNRSKTKCTAVQKDK